MCWARYQTSLELALGAWNAAGLEDQLDQIEAQIAEAVAQDPKSPDDVPTWQQAIADTRNFLEFRASVVGAQLDGAPCG